MGQRGAPSLFKLCTKAAINNVRNLTDVGDLEYRQIRAVLLKVTSPEQLHQIELASPQICGDDGEIWKSFIARDIGSYKTKQPVPESNENWYEVYQNYKMEQQEDIKRDEEILRRAMQGLQKQKESNVSTQVSSKLLPKLPRDPRMIANNGGVPLRKKKQPVLASSFQFESGSRKLKTDGKSVMARVRREAKTESARHKYAIPTIDLSRNRSQITHAPKTMIDQNRKPTPTTRIHAPRKSSAAVNSSAPSSKTRTNTNNTTDQLSLQERERRLNAIKNISNPEPKRTYATHSELNHSDDDIEALFDDNDTKSSISRPPRTPTGPGRHREILDYGKHSSKASTSSSMGKAPLMKVPSTLIPKVRQAPHLSSPTSSPSSPRLAESATKNPTSAIGSRSSTPTLKPEPLKGLIKRRRPEVDIFNRGPAKKPRA